MKNNLRKIRMDVGMSVSELARRASTSRQTIYGIENGTRKNVSGILMFNIADALKRSEREIFFVNDVIHEEHSVVCGA